MASAAAQEAVTVGVPRRPRPGDAPTASRALFGQPPPGQAGSRGGTPTGSSQGGAFSGLEDEDPLLAGGEYAISRAAEGAVALMREALAEAVRSGNAALAQAMCGAVVDIAATVVALPAAGAAGAGAGAAADAQQAEQAAAAAQQQLLLPYPAALRHNDCHYVYQARCWASLLPDGWRVQLRLHCGCWACSNAAQHGTARLPARHLAPPATLPRTSLKPRPPSSPYPRALAPSPRRRCAVCPMRTRRACSSWCTAA